MPAEQQVVVVGGGPVGVALAVDLALRGVAVTVVEKRPGLTRVPKGQGLSQRTMELMHRWGVADALRAERLLPADHPIGQVTTYGDLLGEHWHAAEARGLVAPFYAERNERLPQYLTEGVLRRRLAELPGARLLLGTRATEVVTGDDGVRVTTTGDDGPVVLEADYVVGCDGGRSLVREQLDIARAGTDFDELVALVVFRSPELSRALQRFPDRSTFRVMHPDLRGYWMFFGRVDVDGEFFFHAPVPRDGGTGEQDVVALMHRAAGFEFACDVEHVGFWDLRVQVATSYRRGRAFIAGDAAHTHPPYGGFGLNNGLEDAANLGWKLAAVLDGWAGDALLDSYSAERQPVFRDVGEDVIGGWIRDDRAFLEKFTPDDDPDFAARFADLADGFGRRLRDFEPHYEGSAVVAGPPGGRSGAHGEHLLVARTGHHLPPQELAGGSVLDALGPDLTLVALDAGDADVDAFVAAAARSGTPLAVVRDSRAAGRETWAAGMVLVRPDQFVAWTGERAPDDVDALLAVVTGRAPR